MMETGNSFSLMELFRMGGLFMWPLLFFSVAVIAISLERAIYLGCHNLRMDDLGVVLSDYIREGRLAEGREYLAPLVKRRMGAEILLTLIDRAGLGEQRMERAVEIQALSCINSLENGLNFLTSLGSISQLTGFLGTVSGMIGAFRSISLATEVNAQIVASGIYEALITTAFGLAIAIIAVISHSIFSHIVDRFSADVEQICSTLIAEMTSPRQKDSVREMRFHDDH
ncbi:MAG: MotA/TolQ/ExbB proton channel family protein [Treponema sp.]|jgi:biopolymer transport protein ExbB|nr:MotA/TolQ/ExbB proton channel family protein [Treponema sp.]